MPSKLIRTTGLVALVLLSAAPSASGATQKEIDQAIKAGTAALKARYARGGGSVGPAPNEHSYGIGGTALAGLALLEAGVPANDPAVKAITDQIREGSYGQSSTYQIALCLMYLDRHGDPADVPRIQMLAVRLLVGQTAHGGWGYQCHGNVSAEDEKRLRAMKADQQAGKLHPEVVKYWESLVAARNSPNMAIGPGDDNSNTQFGVLAIWMSRKHGVPVEQALDLIEKRFIATQNGQTGNWAYSGMIGIPGAPAAPAMPGGSPSMYCAGLLGMATAVARREERRKNDPAVAPKTDPKPKPDKPNDPFYNPPAGTPPPKNAAPARPADARDLVVQRGFAGLGLTIADQIRTGKGIIVVNGAHGHADLYFLWSVERVGVIYGVDKIGGVDWYDLGSTALVRSQGTDGTWSISGFGTEVNTAFAVLFLCRSNLARDLSSKVQKDPTNTEMRAGAGPAATEILPNRPTTPVVTIPTINLPNPTGDEAITLASKILKAPDSDWAKLLVQARDTKGTNYTRALVLSATHSEGDRKQVVREVLAERLCRMSADTLRGMLKAEAAELRRAAALACAMKDEPTHIPDLIEVLTDTDDSVTRAAKASLKSLTGKDFGPGTSPTAEQKAQAAAAWKEWFAKEKK